MLVPFFFLIILLNDYLFRLFGWGTHDEEGKAWYELFFYLTYITTIFAILFISYFQYRSEILNNKKSKYFFISELILSSLTTLLVFKFFNVFI